MNTVLERALESRVIQLEADLMEAIRVANEAKLALAQAPATHPHLGRDPWGRDKLVGYSVHAVSSEKYATVSIDRGDPGTLMYKRGVATGAPNGEYFSPLKQLVLPSIPGAEMVLRVNCEIRECMLAVNGSKFRIVVEPEAGE